jgi:structural protein KPP10_ORF10
MSTYSFLDVNCAIVGPGGSFSLGSGAGAAEEGITVTATEEIDGMVIGADGTPMHSLRANKSGKITVHLLKTSPVNKQLSDLQALQRTSGALWGQNTINITNTSTGDQYTCQQVAFAKVPDNVFAKDANILAWEFNAGIIDPSLGAGT